MKSILKLILGLLLVLGINSCSKGDVASSGNSNLLSKLEIQKIGIQHNEALEYVLEGLKNSDVSNSDNPKSMEKFLKSRLNEYYKTVFNDSDVLETATLYSNIEVSKYFDLSNQNNLSKKKDLSPIESVINQYEQHLSSNQINLLLQCDNVINNFSGKNSLSIINELETIQNLAKSQLSEEQAQVIIVGAEVGKMSVAYWSENFDEWQQVLSQGQGQSKNRAKTKRLLWFSWSDVAGADVAAAVGTAVTVAIINVIPGAGQVAYGSAIVAGAAGGSVTSAVYQVWTHFF